MVLNITKEKIYPKKQKRKPKIVYVYDNKLGKE